MMRTERMLRLDILTLEDAAGRVARLLAGEGSMHLVNQNEFPLVPGFDAEAAPEDVLGAASRLLGRIDAALQRIGPAEGPFDAGAALPADRPAGEVISEAEKAIGGVVRRLDAHFAEVEKINAEIARLDDISEEMNLLHAEGLSFADLEMKHFFTAHGAVTRAGLARLSARAEKEPHSMIQRPRRGDEQSVLIVADAERAETWKSWLADAGFRHRPIPERFRRSFDEALDLVEMEIWELRDRLAELAAGFEKERPGLAESLLGWRNLLRVESLLVRSAAGFGRRGPAVLISGYVPESCWPRLRTALAVSASGTYVAEAAPAHAGEGPQVPTMLRNPRFFKPFEMFVRTYGLPGYEDMDPTPLVAVSFLTMFGMMFGDVGHGAMLAAIGFGIARLRAKALEPMRDLGRILMAAGGSGIFFGFLFGSVFGIERDSVLPALWMRPSHGENLTVFLLSALVLGATVMSAGIIMGIVQSFRRRDFRHALAGQWSVCSLVFYWALLYLFAASMAGRPLPVSTRAAVALLAIPLAVIGPGQALMQAARKRRGRQRPGGHGHDEELAAILFEPIEVLMNLFSNSISFLRVAAFGLAHAALTMAVFTISDMTSGAPVVNWLSLPFEHLFIVLLEGMIVTIQCLRLEYYEFFSKFFRGGGVPYAPLAVAGE
ncbi:MAG: hypothetical protein FJ224_04480 [Lentisphaerae bacterium]|nr:hypothetical protein [Lentisphaerota bacterium]